MYCSVEVEYHTHMHTHMHTWLTFALSYTHTCIFTVHTLIFKYLHICLRAHSGVQCLLQKRGLNSSSPNKWSFPGGRLENPGDLDEDGDVGTRRELEEECGGGEPLGLPSLIHIECYKSGKVKLPNLYRRFVLWDSENFYWSLFTLGWSYWRWYMYIYVDR